jgi:hypothetical protein
MYVGDTCDYVAYRYSLVAAQQLSLFPTSRKEVIGGLTEALRTRPKLAYLIKRRRYLLYRINELPGPKFICKLARERRFKKHDEGDEDINIAAETDYPFVYLIIDFQRQIILVQKRTPVFRDIATAKDVLQDLLRKALQSEHYVFTLDEITCRHQFWNVVSRATDGITSLELELRAPNLFGATAEAKDLLQECRDKHNATEIGLRVKNEQGHLRIIRQHFESFINYIAAGGGRYTLDYLIGRRHKRLRSSDVVRVVPMEGNPEQQDPEWLDEKFRELNEGAGE